MKIAIDQHDDIPKFARVTKRLKDKDGLTIRTASKKPILDTRMYEVEYADRYKTATAENAIANNLLDQVDQDEQRFILFDDMIDHRTNGTETKEEDAFIHMANGTKSRKCNNCTLSNLLNTPSRIRYQRRLDSLGGPNMC